ncbi:hypothetical protein ONE63_010135 [Megalurothrips usitatus]|uniref:BRCA1-associated ATM activator 1 n=1 Tax=Megalurothrips usitatus TaxID=439358 RepID=A0AAV7XHU6_9NEOP|nr:hypothetical protein ONE63_010135 [Megalurothrips usitatus]
MTSQGPGLEILEKLAEWSSKEIETNIDQILQEHYSHLNGEDKGHVLQAVYALLVTCLPCLPLDVVDKSLLCHTMPVVQLLFQESLEGIQLRLDDKSQSDIEDIADTLSSLLQVCIELLKCLECVLQYLVSQGSVNISSVPNVPKTAAVIMLQTFKHCKESESLYQEVFPTMADLLGSVFRQCHQVQCRFFSVITTNLTYDCSVETDIVHLVDVLQILSEVGEHIMSLDIKTMAEQWKGYAKILQMYLEPLRNRLNIAYPLNYLCLEISKNLEHLVSQESPKDPRSVTRLIKTTSFILKIVVKLCEQFGSGNGCLRGCHSSLYKLLLSLHRYSPSMLLTQNVDSSIVDEMERSLFIAADPLLSHIICEDGFREEFFKNSGKVCNAVNDRLPHLSLMPSVMKKLASFSAEDKNFWLGDTRKSNIIGCLLELLKHSHSELSCEIWFPGVVKPGESRRTFDFYESLCCHCAGFVLSFNAEQYQKVECMLMDSLLEPFIWPAVFSSDVWCICARAGSSELVLDQVLYFADIASSFEPTSLTERVECQVFSLFIHRMCSFLGAKGKQVLFEKFPPLEHPLLWQIFGLHCLPKEAKESVPQQMISNTVAHVQNFISSNTSVKLFNQMIFSLCGLCAALECSSKSSVDRQKSVVPSIISLWQYTCPGDIAEHLSPLNKFLNGPKWLTKLLGLLCKCTEGLVQVMSNEEILQILNLMERVFNCCNSSVKLSLLRILHGLATKTLEASQDQGLVCSKISHLFTCFLEDSHQIVMETTLETFEYFAHFTAHESVVADAVGNNVAIQEVVTSYLQKEAPAVESNVPTLNHQEYLTFQGKICLDHICEVKKQRNLSSQSPEKPAKKIRLDCDDTSDLSAFLADDLFTEFVEEGTSDAVERILKDTQYLTSKCSFSSLSVTLKTDLKRAVEQLNKFIN